MDKHRILIVDDDETLRFLLKKVLDKFEVYTVSDGEKGIDLYNRIQPKIVLMDIMMKPINGIETTKKILQIDPQATIIGFSAFSRIRGEAMLEAGAKEIISKPVKMNFLRSKIERHIKQMEL
jgi:DNA-binding response OmpR family regulator